MIPCTLGRGWHPDDASCTLERGNDTLHPIGRGWHPEDDATWTLERENDTLHPIGRGWHPEDDTQRMIHVPLGEDDTLKDDDENPYGNDTFTINRRWHWYSVHKREDDTLRGWNPWNTIEIMWIHLGMTPVPLRANDTPKGDDTCTLESKWHS